METMIKVLIADDHQMHLDGVQSFLASEKNIRVVAEARNGLQVLEKLAHTEVDIAIIDIGMPELDGYETVLKMKHAFPQIRIIVLSLHDEEKYIGKLLKAGVSGYIIKKRGSEELIKAINEVAAGREYFDSEVVKISLRAMQNKNAGPERQIQFTPRETEVLHLVAEGLSTKEIAERLFRAESTVDTHKKNLLQKLDLPNSKHLMKYAIEKGYGRSSLH